MMEDEDTESYSKISTLWKCKLCDWLAHFHKHQIKQHYATSQSCLCSKSWLSLSFLGRTGAGGQSRVCELNTSCNLNLLWATYYRLLLLSSLFSLSSLTSPPLCCSFSLIFFFNDETERKKAAFLLPVNYPPVCLSVRLNWRLGDARVVPAGSARTMEAHIADRPSTQPKLNWKSSIFSLA